MYAEHSASMYVLLYKRRHFADVIKKSQFYYNLLNPHRQKPMRVSFYISF